MWYTLKKKGLGVQALAGVELLYLESSSILQASKGIKLFILINICVRSSLGIFYAFYGPLIYPCEYELLQGHMMIDPSISDVVSA